MFDKIVLTLKKQMPDIKIIYLFGSQATGNARADSDFEHFIKQIARYSDSQHL
ncbi:nucleotidyltransferase domain-containing protein [Pectobacterium actinidiae]|uniref:nucleotidyltransferase domain-containing protein n=1 Tax=Pectobacterium actinidiae TaxID=1507808 RepID=UPI0021BD3A17